MSQLDNVFQALSDPTRRAILQKLIESENNLGELAKPFDLSIPMISKHVKILENAGLIARRIEKQQRIFSLTQSAFVEIDKFLAQFRRVFNKR